MLECSRAVHLVSSFYFCFVLFLLNDLMQLTYCEYYLYTHGSSVYFQSPDFSLCLVIFNCLLDISFINPLGIILTIVELLIPWPAVNWTTIHADIQAKNQSVILDFFLSLTLTSNPSINSEASVSKIYISFCHFTVFIVTDLVQAKKINQILSLPSLKPSFKTEWSKMFLPCFIMSSLAA